MWHSHIRWQAAAEHIFSHCLIIHFFHCLSFSNLIRKHSLPSEFFSIFFLKVKHHQHCNGFHCDEHGPSFSLRTTRKSMIMVWVTKSRYTFALLMEQKVLSVEKSSNHLNIQQHEKKYTIWRWNRADFDFYHYCSPQIFRSHHITKRYSIWNWN